MIYGSETDCHSVYTLSCIFRIFIVKRRFISNIDDSTNHKLSSFTALKEEITSHYKQLLKSVEDKITQMCKESKQIWRKLDDVEEKCEKWTQEINRLRDEQVRKHFVFSLV